MRKATAFLLCLMGLASCSKHDPILPGTRTAIFDAGNIVVLNHQIENLPAAANEIKIVDCPYVQDSTNVIWDGDRRIFSGFPTSNSVKNTAKPVCADGYVYAGLTTGELIKVNPKNRRIAWVADIYRDTNLTGGSSILDIVAPVVVDGKTVYVSGLGDTFCRINADNGAKKWCVNIGTALPYIIAGDAIFVVATDGRLYALRAGDGAIYWRAELKKALTPSYADEIITIGREKFNAKTGAKI